MQYTAPTQPRLGLTARQVAAKRRFVGDLQQVTIEGATCTQTPDRTDKLRERAHAAFFEVVTRGDQALDAALDVYSHEISRLRARLTEQTEVLKLIHIYASEPWLRSFAAAALVPGSADPRQHLPVTLFDPEVATGADCEGRQ